MNREQRRPSAKARREYASTRALPVDQRVRRGWLVQAAAWTRSWRLLQWAGRQVVLEQRQPGGRWHRLPVRVEIRKDGTIEVVTT